MNHWGMVARRTLNTDGIALGTRVLDRLGRRVLGG